MRRNSGKQALEAGIRPGPKPGLSAKRIARAAIRVADAEGLAAVSMQRIAREVRVTTMALYRYFSNKAELVDLMIDNAGGPPPDLDEVSAEWRPRIEEWTRRCSSIYRMHPWFLEATAGRRIMGPNELGWVESALKVLGETGLSAYEQHQVFLVLMGHVRSNAEFAAGMAKGLSGERWIASMRKLLKDRRDQYPALVAAIDAGAFGKSRRDGLSFGLKCILDGVELLMKRGTVRKTLNLS